MEIKDAEIKVAHQLIEALAGEWDPEKYHDTFQENLKKLIETKLEGGEIQAVEQPKKLAPVVDLMAALKESLAQTKKPSASEKVAEMPAKKKRRPGVGARSFLQPAPSVDGYPSDSTQSRDLTHLRQPILLFHASHRYWLQSEEGRFGGPRPPRDSKRLISPRDPVPDTISDSA